MPGASGEQLQVLKSEVTSLRGKNKRLSVALAAAREQLVAIHQQLADLVNPPATVAVIAENPDKVGQVRLYLNGKPMVLRVHPDVKPEHLQVGIEVLVNEEMVVSKVLTYPRTGTLVQVGEIISQGRALVRLGNTGTEIVSLAAPLIGKIEVGDSLLLEARSGIAVQKVQRGEVEQLLAPQIPNVSYKKIGGLEEQIETIRDAVELPFTHPDLYRRFGLRAPKGILLYGPPGCGKTLIAKAVATSLGANSQGKVSYFLSIKGPELLSKFVGETERQIRAIFSRARQLASSEHPVVIFFDEMEALFRTRGSGISSDVETMIVPQLLSEIDGVEELSNVMVIGASNREDMIDPAVLRPGRLDVRVRIERPTLEQAGQIFEIHLGHEVPIGNEEEKSPGVGRKQLREKLLALLAEESVRTQIYEVAYENGKQEIVYAHSLLSGAMIASIVERAKKAAIKDSLKNQGKVDGLTFSHVERAAEEEIRETAALGASTDPGEWARTLGVRRGMRIVDVRSLQ
ncbi:proteasome ATPase [Varibaculum vaginae]|uniref:proteasome ATPase n=1 Tax=Varibaculum vaginae TaxID=2364797 RepID=UPI000F08B5D5|nr:proteasome ATPase [Varibaculum vaginae]